MSERLRKLFQTSIRSDVIAILAILGATAVFSWQRFWFWNGLDYLDIPTFYAPWYAFLGEQLRSLTLPGWNPHLFSGTLFAADPQSGWWYFPAMVFFTFLDPVDAYIWMIVFHLLLTGISTYIFARMIGCRPIAAFVAAFCYEFGPLSNHISCCLIHVELATWIPLSLIGVELSIRAEDFWGRLRGWLLCAFAVSQIFAGWVGQGSYNGALLIGAYLALRTLTVWLPRSSRILAFSRAAMACAVTFGLALSFAAAGLLPRLFLLRESNVSGGEYTGHGTVDYALGWTVPEMLDKLLSDGNGYFTALYYVGLSTVVLGLCTLPRLTRSFHVAFFWSVVVLTSILSLERITPIHRLFYLLPRFETLHEHVPMRILAIQWIAVAMLAGLGVEYLYQHRRSVSPRVMASLAGVPLLALILYFGWDGHDLSGWSVAATLALLAVIVLLAKSPAPQIARLVVTALLILIVWEPAGRHFMEAVGFGEPNPVLWQPPDGISRESVAENLSSTDPGGAGEFLQSMAEKYGPFRYFGYDSDLQVYRPGLPSTYREWFYSPRALDLLINARAMGLGLYDVQGYNPVQLLSYVEFMNALNGQEQNYHDAQILRGGLFSPLLDLLGVRYIVVPAVIPPGRPDLLHLSLRYPTVFQNGSVRVLENRSALPRGWLASDVIELPADQQIAAIKSPVFDVHQDTVVAPGLPTNVADLAGDGQGTVDSTMVNANTLQIRVEVDHDSILVVSEVNASGWKAYVNGSASQIVQADGIFRAIVVPAGTSLVEFRYEPVSLRIGVWISFVSYLLSIVCFAVQFIVKRRTVLRDLLHPKAALNQI